MNILTRELERKYDHLCGRLFAHFYCKMKDKEGIKFVNLSPNNKDHLFVLYCAKAAGGITHTPITLDLNRFQLHKINKNIKEKEFRFLKRNKKEQENWLVYDIQDALDFIYPNAEDQFGDAFTLGEIYDAFYNPKTKGRK